jgi:uncharacterized repeat protein (TIGR01451 family)
MAVAVLLATGLIVLLPALLNAGQANLALFFGHRVALAANLAQSGVPAITVTHYANGYDADSLADPLPLVTHGARLTWTQVVVNSGAGALDGLQIALDHPADSLSCAPVALGDSLAAGGVTTCTAISLVDANTNANAAGRGVITASAVVTGTAHDGTEVSAADLAHYRIVAPAVGLEAYTNGYEADTLDDARAQVVDRATIVWAYQIVNLGDTPLENIALGDDRLGSVDCPQVSLEIGSSMVCVVTGTARLAQTTGGIYTNTATVIANVPPPPSPALPEFAPAPLPPVSATDRSHYELVTAHIEGRVWDDADVDGRQDAGDEGVAGVAVDLLNRQGRTIARATTNAAGRYEFPDLTPGVYSLRFRAETLPAGYRFTHADQADETQDSDADPSTGLSVPLTLAAKSRGTVDAGVFAVRFGVALEKRANSRLATEPFAAGVPQIPPGTPVLWSYVVTNTSNVPLARAAIDVTDDVAGSLMRAGELQVLAPLFGTVSYAALNPLADGVLEPGEAFELRVTWPAPNLDALDPAASQTDAWVRGCDDRATSDDETRVAHRSQATATIPGASATAVSHFCNPPVRDLALRTTILAQSSTPLVPGGSYVTYEIEVFNQGNVAASAIEIVDYVPSGLVFESSLNPPWSQSDAGKPTTRLLAPLAAGASVTTAITLRVDGGTAGQQLTNIAEIAGFSGGQDADSTPDRDPGNDGAAKNDIVDERGKEGDDEDDHDGETISVAKFDLALRTRLGVAPTPIVAGQSELTFQIEVFNQGDAPAYAIDLVNHFEPGLGFAGTDVNPHWQALNAADTTTVKTTLAGPLQPGASAAVNIVATVDAGAVGRTVTTFAEIAAADNDQVANNNPPEDVDSVPDTWNGNTPGEQESEAIDDDLDGTDGARGIVAVVDEDDHDRSQVDIPAMSVGGRLWLDRNDSGALDAGEPGLPGVKIQLHRDADGDGSIAGAEATTPFATAWSDGAGDYSFTRLAPGSYAVVVPTPPAGYPRNSSQPAVSDDTVDGDDTGTQSGAGGPTVSPVIALAPGAEPADDGDDANGDRTLDFGFYAPVAVGNLVWLDADADGTWEAGEPPLAGATVELLDVDRRAVRDSAGAIVAPQVTGVDGSYLFVNLRPGEYKVGVTPPDGGYLPSPTAADSDAGPVQTDSHGSTAPGQRRVESLPFELINRIDPAPEVAGAAAIGASGDVTDGADRDLTMDFGFYRLVVLDGRVWLDANNNGLLDEAEGGLDGISLQLFYDRDGNGLLQASETTPYSTTETAGGGYYRFTGLRPGSYLAVVPAPPAAYPISSTPPPGASGDKDDDGFQEQPGAPVSSGWTTLLTGADSDTGDVSIDFGFFRFDLALRVRVGGLSSAPLVAGQSTVTFTIEVINQGTVPAENVRVIDYPHPALVVDPANNPGWSADPSPAISVPGRIEPGQSAVVRLVAGLGSAAAGQTLDNFAEILDDGSGSPSLDVDSIPDSSNIEMPVKDDIIAENGKANPGIDDEDDHDVAQVGAGVFDLALRVFVGGRSEQPLRPGSQVTFTVEVINQGDAPASEVQVVSYPGLGFVFDPAANPGWSSEPNPVTTIPGVLPPGATATVEIAFAVAQSVSDAILWNAAEIAAAGGGSIDIDSTPDLTNDETGVRDDVVTESGARGGDEDDHDVVQVYVFLGGFDLALRMRLAQSGSQAVDAGRDATFNIEVFNQGTVPARDIVIVDYLPQGFLLSPAAVDRWTQNGGHASLTLAGPLDPGQTIVVPIALRTGLGTGTFFNAAEIAGARDGSGAAQTDVDSVADSDQGNDRWLDDVVAENGKLGEDEDDHDGASVAVERFDLALRVRLAKGQPFTASPGKSVKYTIEVFNQGTVTATNIAVVNYIPQGLTMAAVHQGVWAADEASQLFTVLPGPLASGERATVPIVLDIGANVAARSIRNLAEIAQAGDAEGRIRLDYDSLADRDPTNDRILDDIVDDDRTVDEDDHDGATIFVDVKPTAIALVAFTAYVRAGVNEIYWETNQELNTIGYYIYRSADDNPAHATRITPQIVFSLGSNGGTYTVMDGDAQAVQAGSTYRYWLVELEQSEDGQRNLNLYGPIKVTNDSGAPFRDVVVLPRVFLPAVLR